ncbi:Uncharacterised protein [Mycobacterium tuberculosis]|nr:Uncharacterised protein [Mycobacterium tuberculosis]
MATRSFAPSVPVIEIDWDAGIAAAAMKPRKKKGMRAFERIMLMTIAKPTTVIMPPAIRRPVVTSAGIMFSRRVSSSELISATIAVGMATRRPCRAIPLMCINSIPRKFAVFAKLSA